MPKQFDRSKFNTDPAHEQERNQFDAMVEDSLNRVAEKKRKDNKDNPPKEPSFLDDLLSGIGLFGNKDGE